MKSNYHDCKCGALISGEHDLCLKCRSQRLTADCDYYNEIERSITVPWCEYYDCEILSFGYWKCRDCERRG